MEAPPESRIASSERWLVVALLVVALALRVLGIDAPWSGKGFGSAIGAFSTAEFVDNWHAHGPSESGGMPYRWRVELADGSVEREWYAHHPATRAWISWLSTSLFGFTEWAVRLPWVIGSMALPLALWAALRRLFGRGVALGGLALVASVPLAAHYAPMAWVDNGIMTAVMVVMVLRFLVWLERGERRDLIWAAAAALVGGCLDWSLAMALPALGVAALGVAWKRRNARPVAGYLWLPGMLFVAVTAHAGHMLFVFGFEELWQDFTNTWSRTRSSHVEWNHFFAVQGRALLHNLGAATIAVAALGLVEVALRARRLGALRVWSLAALLLPGALYVFVFPFRGANHDFMWIHSIGGVAALVGFGLLLVARLPQGRWVAGAAALVLVGIGARATIARERETSSDAVRLASEHAQLAPLLNDPDGVIVTAMGQSWTLMPYSRTPIVPRVDQIDELERLRTKVLGRLEPERPVHFLFDVQFHRVHAPLREYLRAHAPPPVALLDGLHADPIVAFEIYDLGAWVTR